MKTRKIVLVAGVAVAFVMMACDMYDDGVPSKSVRNEFKAMYSGARDVEWEREGMYWSVSYEMGTFPDVVEYESLYDRSGKWVMTENDMPLSAVPENIKGFLAASKEYGSLELDDNEVECYQTPDGNFYRFDLVSGGRDIDVDVTEDGTVTLAGRDRF